MRPKVSCLLVVAIAWAIWPASVAALPPGQGGDALVQAQAYWNAGMEHLNAGNYDAARQAFEKAQPLFLAARDDGGQAWSFYGMGLANRALGQWEAALEAYGRSLPLWEALEQDAVAADTHNAMGQIYQVGLNDLERALAEYSSALDAYRTLGDRAQEAVMHNQIGSIFHALEQYQAAEDSYRQALELCQVLDDDVCRASVLNNIGEVYDSKGEIQEALVRHKAALAACEATAQCTDLKARLVYSIGRDCIHLGQYETAQQELERALQLTTDLGDEELSATILVSIGALDEKLAHYEDALARHRAALDIFARLGHIEGQEVALNGIGSVYGQQGRWLDAVDSHQASLDMALKRQSLSGGATSGEATSLGNLGTAYEALGLYEDALRAHQDALSIWQALKHRSGQGSAHNNLGAVYESLGQYERAESHYREALRIYTEMEDQSGMMYAQNNLGALLFSLGRYEDALVYYRLAQEIAIKIGDPRFQALALDNIGAAQSNLDRTDEALASHGEALEIRTSIGDRAGEGASHSNLSALYANQGQYDQALEDLAVALSISEELGQTARQAQVLGNIGRVYYRQGELPEAIAYYERAIEQIEVVQGEVAVEELGATFGARQVYLYNWLIDALVSEGNVTRALEVAERARARVFLSQIGNQQVDFRQGAAPGLVQEEQALRQQILGLQNALSAESSRPINQQDQAMQDRLSQELETARRAYAELVTRLKLANPEYAALVSVGTLTLQEVRNQVLDEQTTLIAYWLLEEQTLAWVIDQESYEMLELDISTDELQSQAGYLRNLIADRDFEAQVATELYDRLFAPLKTHVHHTNLVIVPHGVLHYLPFAALWDATSERYLVEDYTITYAPSASVLKFILDKRTADEGRLLALGNPDGSLPYAQNEVAAIGALYATTPLTDTQATESQVHAQAAQVDVLHLAAHGVYNPYNPLFTYIKLAPDQAQDGNLEVHEVYGLDLRQANLVVLSACNSALGQQSAGDEVVGLTRAFLYAGTPAVATTLWRIDDAASGELMVAFYRHLRAGLTNAAALRAAQLEVLAQDRWQTPYYWAAFSLTGDYRGSRQPGATIDQPPTPTATVPAEQMPAHTPTREAQPTPGRGGICTVLPVGLVVLMFMYRKQRHRRPRL